MTDTGPSFSGTKGEGADLNLDVPLPGSYSGTRYLQIEDIPDDYWLPSAKEDGTPYAEALGMTLDPTSQKWSIVSPESFVGTWMGKKASVSPSLSTTEVESAKNALITDASAVTSAHGSLGSWRTSGSLFQKSAAVLKSE